MFEIKNIWFHRMFDSGLQYFFSLFVFFALPKLNVHVLHFLWSWNYDIQILMLSTITKVDWPPFFSTNFTKSLPVKVSNPIQSIFLCHASFHWLTTISCEVKPAWEVTPLEDDDVWIKGVSSLCEFLYNILLKHFCFFAMWRQKF